jgi:hypothetical protein
MNEYQLLPSEPVTYHMRVLGHLDQHWSAWFNGMTIMHEPGGTILISGTIIDQSALYGLLSKARDLGLTLLSVEQANALPRQER